MKKHVLILAWIMLAMVAPSAGCAKGTTTAIAQTITGGFEYLTVPLAWGETVPLEYGNANETANETATVTVQTKQGPQTVLLTSNTTYSIDGQACKLEDLGKIYVEGDTTYNCSIVVAPCEPEGYKAIILSLFTITK
ncbi:MAG: hypothetical protein Q7J73_04545 [Dehalococcoidales bacterium]|nr:hypothetical protein [Dehalococcoidales bacterium]